MRCPFGGLVDGQLSEQQRVHDAEDRRVRADPKRERRDGGCREALVFRERTTRVPQIGAQFVEKPETETVAGLLLVLLDRPELEARGAPRFLRREATRDQIVGAALEVKSHFV